MEQTNKQTNKQTSGHLNDTHVATQAVKHILVQKKVVDRALPTSSHQRRKVSAKEKLQSVNQSINCKFISGINCPKTITL